MGDFIIDSQTFNDLNIFSDTLESNSIFSLFKHTRTMAARNRLMEIMQNPSNDLEEITSRKDAIKYFHDNQITLEVKNEEVDFIEFYLQSKFREFRNNPIDALADYVMRKSGNDYYIIKTGLKYLIQLTKYILKFIEHHKTKQHPKLLMSIFEQIINIVEAGVLFEATKLNEKRITYLNVCRLDRALRGAEKENVKTLLKLIYELDVLENIALVAAANGFTFPAFKGEVELKFRVNGLFHPSIKNAVKNDIYLDHNQNIIFLSGSNMAGKSSLLKSLGLVIYLSHLGFPVPADGMETSVFNGLVTTINLPDNMNEGLSHYYTEVKRVKEIAKTLMQRDNLFVIFDELFRGTNAKDAYDGSSLIISELAAIKSSAFIISTHIIELAAVLGKFNNISFHYLDTYFESQKPVFTYVLKEGISKELLGMFIVLNEGIVEILRLAAKKNV